MKDKLIFLSPKSREDFEKYFLFRWKMLREPWSQKQGSEIDKFEEEAFHIMGVSSTKNIFAVGRLHMINKHIAQIRYMAVLEQYKKLGYGTQVLKLLENYALNNQTSKVVLNSRESAINFYIKNGYKKIKQVDRLFGQINHWFMEKEIN
jgi:ribosomal protein S18 acetylase RimI-like enzyme